MQTKIPPPIVTLIFIGILYLSNSLITPFELAYQSVIGIFLILSGLGILIASVRVFRKVGTTVNPVDPNQASMLVVEGPFTFSRNPMYLGMSEMLIGFGFIFGAWLTLPIVALFIIYITIFQILPEEVVMKEKFADYDEYCSKVRRWI